MYELMLKVKRKIATLLSSFIFRVSFKISEQKVVFLNLIYYKG